MVGFYFLISSLSYNLKNGSIDPRLCISPRPITLFTSLGVSGCSPLFCFVLFETDALLGLKDALQGWMYSAYYPQ